MPTESFPLSPRFTEVDNSRVAIPNEFKFGMVDFMPTIPEFLDYHRTIIGFHGTTLDTATRLVNGEPFQESNQDDEWFGIGIYFWEYGPK
jgi:hypothetical protein